MISTSRKLLDFTDREVLSTEGVAYTRFRKDLPKPRYWALWLQLLTAYAALVSIAAVCSHFAEAAPAWKAATSILCGAAFGYVLAFIYLFLHEVAHHGLSQNHLLNDRLGSLLIASFFATHLGSYREAHWRHHRELGTISDPENSYFSALSPAFWLGRLFWGGTVNVLLSKLKPGGARAESSGSSRAGSMCLGVALHGTVISGLVITGQWVTALAWVTGVTMFFPLFASLRQVAEHRSFEADPATDYFSTDHGAVSRIFSDGPFASTFGAAGFNRHLIHHWDPSVSCTQLRAVEKFLLESNAAAAVASSRTTYFKAITQLLSNA